MVISSLKNNIQAWDGLLMELVSDDKITIGEDEIETTDGNSLVGLKVAEAGIQSINKFRTAKEEEKHNQKTTTTRKDPHDRHCQSSTMQPLNYPFLSEAWVLQQRH